MSKEGEVNEQLGPKAQTASNLDQLWRKSARGPQAATHSLNAAT